MDVCLSILTGDELQGVYSDDRIDDDFNWGFSTKFECSLQERADGEMLRILLFDRAQNELDYAIYIEEFNAISYADLDYDALEITVDGNTFDFMVTEDDKIFEPYNTGVTGKAFHFVAEKGREYTITCEFYKHSILINGLKLFLLHPGKLTGDYRDDVIISYGTGEYQHEQNTTLTGIYTANVSGKVKLLVFDNLHQEYEVSINIETTGEPVTFSVTGGNGSLRATVDGATVASPATVKNGKSVVFTANPNSGYRVKEWTLNDEPVTNNTSNTYTLTDISAAATVTVEFESSQITNSPGLLPANPLRAWIRDGLLYITGLTTGETVSIYAAGGALVYRSVATSDTVDILLKQQGVYVVTSGNNTVKVVFQ